MRVINTRVAKTPAKGEVFVFCVRFMSVTRCHKCRKVNELSWYSLLKNANSIKKVFEAVFEVSN